MIRCKIIQASDAARETSVLPTASQLDLEQQANVAGIIIEVSSVISQYFLR